MRYLRIYYPKLSHIINHIIFIKELSHEVPRAFIFIRSFGDLFSFVAKREYNTTVEYYKLSTVPVPRVLLYVWRKSGLIWDLYERLISKYVHADKARATSEGSDLYLGYNVLAIRTLENSPFLFLLLFRHFVTPAKQAPAATQSNLSIRRHSFGAPSP